MAATESEVCDGEYVLFAALTDPVGEESNISWSGGGTPATGTGATFYTKWTTGSTGTKIVTATYCNDSKSESVNVLFDCDCDRIGEMTQLTTLGGWFDDCENYLSYTDMEGVKRLWYNFSQIGHCPYAGSMVQIRYWKTVNDAKYHSTFFQSCDLHGNNEPYPGDEGTGGKFDFVIWTYDCITDTLDENCRENNTFCGTETSGTTSNCEHRW